jgi:hypothetical protein
MGGDLRDAPAGKSPTFLVAAMKDPLGANLDRIQVIKGWLDARSELHEKVYDVVWSGDRKPDTKGKLPSVGSTVDVVQATWKNTIGAPELITVWKDPDFDPRARAFYYVRVIEIPTPRWPAYDANRFGVTPPPGTTMTRAPRWPSSRGLPRHRSGPRSPRTAGPLGRVSEFRMRRQASSSACRGPRYSTFSV